MLLREVSPPIPLVVTERLMRILSIYSSLLSKQLTIHVFYTSWQCASMDGEVELCRSPMDCIARTGRLVPGAAHASGVLLCIPPKLLRARILVFLCALLVCLDNTKN